MRCEEGAEFVSALCDGERIPPAAAEHIGVCAICRARMTEYLEMGAELRRMASLNAQQNVTPMAWNQSRGSLATWWQKGWERMRIPRIVFAVLVIGVVLLGSGLAVVGARASSESTVVMLKVSAGSGNTYDCAFSTKKDKRLSVCSAIGKVNTTATTSGVLGDEVSFLGIDGNRILIGVRSIYAPIEPGKPDIEMGTDTVANQPQQQYSFTPGDTLRVNVAGFGDLTITGEWMDHVPVAEGQLDPDADQLRILTPVILRGDQVLGDLGFGSAYEQHDMAVMIYLAGQGRFIFSPSPIPGAVQAKVNFNRITFEANGQAYKLVAGAPITRSDHVWVLYQPDFAPAGDAAAHSFIAGGEVDEFLKGTR
jgi:hypothetical protein